MSFLKFILVVLICVPVGYLLLYLNYKIIDEVLENKGKAKDEERPIYNNRRSRRGR